MLEMRKSDAYVLGTGSESPFDSDKRKEIEMTTHNMESALGREYSRALDPRALSEIASWCEMATKGLKPDGAEGRDLERYRKTAEMLRALAADAREAAA